MRSSITPGSVRSRSSTVSIRTPKPRADGRLAGHEGERVGAAFEVGQRERVGLGGIGVVDPLRDAPAAGLLARDRRGASAFG